MCPSKTPKKKKTRSNLTHLGNNLELLALAVLGLGNGLLETGEGLGVELLRKLLDTVDGQFAESRLSCAYLSTGDVEVDLTTVSAHQGSELLADTLEGTETVVLGKGLEEVLDETGLVGTGNLGELRDDGLLVGIGQGGGAEDGGQLLVGLEGLAEVGDATGGLVEGSGLGGGSVLFKEWLEGFSGLGGTI
jgi:hypothetical protein